MSVTQSVSQSRISAQSASIHLQETVIRFHEFFLRILSEFNMKIEAICTSEILQPLAT